MRLNRERSRRAGLPRLRLLAAVGVPLIAGVGVAATLPASAAPPPGHLPGWHSVFFDNFSGPAGSGIDNRWNYDIGTQYTGTGCTPNWGTGEVETETASTANAVENGHGLTITPVESNGSWTSARLETVRDNFAAPAGGEMEVSASIQQPDPANGLGYWPAFWMLGSGYRSTGFGTDGLMDCSAWPTTGEIDIMEDVNALSDVSGTLHCGFVSYVNGFNGGPCNEYTGLSSGLQKCPGCQTGYNTYAVVVDRTDPGNGQIRWYLDGREYFSVSESRVGATYWNDVVDHGFMIILDVAMGGAFPNAICGCSSPSSSTTSGAGMNVAWVSVAVRGGQGHLGRGR
jgi:beta-glucanase (GH16 family)